MPLRGRVGRHVHTGKHCQNWKSDQQHVIALLNRFPAEHGGAAGSLNARVVAGVAGETLYKAILRFQKQQGADPDRLGLMRVHDQDRNFEPDEDGVAK